MPAQQIRNISLAVDTVRPCLNRKKNINHKTYQPLTLSVYSNFDGFSRFFYFECLMDRVKVGMVLWFYGFFSCLDRALAPGS